MKIWEYKAGDIMGTHPVNDLISYEKLNKMGSKGWELFYIGDTARVFSHRVLWGAFKRKTDENVVGKIIPGPGEKKVEPKAKTGAHRRPTQS